MIVREIQRLAVKRKRSLLRVASLVVPCLALWYGARAGGEAFAEATYARQMAECARRLDRIADAIRRYHQEHPDLPITEISPQRLYPAYVADPIAFRCPAAQPARRMQPVGSIYSSYVWCNLGPNWSYIHRRRGDEIPLLVCTTHARASVADNTANVVRLRGPVERSRIPQGVEGAEW